MDVLESSVQITIRGTIFDKIVEELNDLETNRFLGDPLSSAIACILARSTRQPIIIEESKREQKEKKYQIIYKIKDSTSNININ